MDIASREVKGDDFSMEDSSPSMAVQTSACLISGCSAVVPRSTVTGYQDVALLSCTSLVPETNMMTAIAKQPVAMAFEAEKGISQQHATGILSVDYVRFLVHGVVSVGCGALATGGD